MGTKHKKSPAVFIDRDGTVIREKNYLSKIKDIKLLKGAVEALKMLKTAGYKLIFVTNQSGIARGFLTETKLRKIHLYLDKMLKKKGVSLDAIYYCPHHPTDSCTCRKPNTGLVRKAAKRFNLDLRRSFSIGDHTGDFLLGQNMGGKGIFILTGHGKKENEKISKTGGKLKPDHTAKNLLSAAKWILNRDSDHLLTNMD